MNVLTVGTICFGLLVGYITYRTLARTTASASISDLAAVISAVGGGGVTAIVKPGTDLFGWYAIGLLAGFIIYGAIYWAMNGHTEFAKVMGRGSEQERAATRGADAPHIR
jgi:bacteriorhodopsin